MTARANTPIEEGVGGRGGGGSSSAAAAAAAVAAAAAGVNAIAPSATAEAESLLECLTELLPVLEEAQAMTDRVSAC